jgi:hypothetical protein
MSEAVLMANTIATANPTWTDPAYDNAQTQEDRRLWRKVIIS